jgi:hypothetical protein
MNPATEQPATWLAQLRYAIEHGNRSEAVAYTQAVLDYVATLEHYTNPMQHEHARDRARFHLQNPRA